MHGHAIIASRPAWKACEVHDLNEPVVRTVENGTVHEFRDCKNCPVTVLVEYAA